MTISALTGYMPMITEKICYDASPVVDGSWIFITTWGGDNDSYVVESTSIYQ